jgi:hypothetical protein
MDNTEIYLHELEFALDGSDSGQWLGILSMAESYDDVFKKCGNFLYFLIA